MTLPSCTVSVAPDGLRAHVALTPGLPPLSRTDVEDALAAAGVEFGVSAEDIDRALHLLEVHGALPRPVCVAEGRAPEPSQGTRIEWITQLDVRVGTIAGQRIDFRERGSVVNVQAGQRLAILHPPVSGRPGRRVDGVPITVPGIKGERLRAGENVRTTELDDGRLTFDARTDGMLICDDGRLCVVDMIEVHGDVDYSTGNQDVRGAIHVHGTVREGFRVTAGSDVIIDGSVEEATVECGGNLIVMGAVIGGPNGYVSGARGVQVHHAQNADIRSEGDVVFEDSDSGSRVVCHGRIAGSGRLRGGNYSAAIGVSARELGSELGAPTHLKVGASDTLGSELAALHLALAEANRRAKKLQRENVGANALRITAHLSPSSAAAARQTVKARRETVGTHAAMRERHRRLAAAFAAKDRATVEVENTVHAGVEIDIAGQHHVTDAPLRHVRFEIDPEHRVITVRSL